MLCCRHDTPPVPWTYNLHSSNCLLGAYLVLIGACNPVIFDDRLGTLGIGNTNVDICLSQLRDEGYTSSTVIGVVKKGPRDPNRPSHQTITCK